MRKLIPIILCTLFLIGCTPSAPKAASVQEEDLQRYEQAFSFSSESFNWNAQALAVTYESPEKLDLASFFMNGIGTQVLTDEEEEFIKQAKVDPGYDIARIDVAEASDILESCFGITWEETERVGLDRLLYNEKERCYYLAANGTNVLEMLDIHSGTRNADGSVSLTYSKTGITDREYVVTFVEEKSADGVCYRFLSNVLCE